MECKKKNKALIVCLGLCFAYITLLIITIMYMVLTEEKSRSLIFPFILFSILAIVPVTVIIVALFYVTIKSSIPGIDYLNDRESHNDFNLRIYACKNGRYIYKILSSTGRGSVDFRDYDDKMFQDYPYNFFDEIYSTDDPERPDDILDIIDSRSIDNALFFEAKTVYGFAYAYIDPETKKYGIILINSSEAKEINDINNAKKRLVLENDRIIEKMDLIFDEVESDGRIISEKYDDDLSIRDVMIKISEFID